MASVRWVALGNRAIRFPRPAGPSARVLVRALRAWPGVTDVVVTREDVAVYFAGAPRADESAIDALAHLRDDADTSRLIEIDVNYDGPDLVGVARAAGLSEEEVVRRHSASTYTVETMGFAPGFAYLAGLDPQLSIARRSSPRTRVPAGSLALAGGYTAVYPFDSPGGWHLIGRAKSVRMFSETGALLRLGDRVRFVP